MVRVLVRERDDVDAPVPRRDRLAEATQEPRAVGSTVDEDVAAVALDEERISLADVERVDARAGGPR